MSFVRYYLFWPMYIGLWVRRYSSTTRGRDEGFLRQKTIVEHELDYKYWQEKHFWAPVAGLIFYSLAWALFMLIPTIGLGLSLTTFFILLMSYFYFLFVLSPTSLLLVFIYSSFFPTNGIPMDTILLIYLPIIKFGFFGLPIDYF